MKYRDKEFAVDQRINDIFSVFSYNFNFTQAPSCAYKGYDKFYSYRFNDETGIDFSTVPIGWVDTICEVYATSVTVSTAKGIKPGSTESELKGLTEQIVPLSMSANTEPTTGITL